MLSPGLSLLRLFILNEATKVWVSLNCVSSLTVSFPFTYYAEHTLSLYTGPQCWPKKKSFLSSFRVLQGSRDLCCSPRWPVGTVTQTITRIGQATEYRWQVNPWGWFLLLLIFNNEGARMLLQGKKNESTLSKQEGLAQTLCSWRRVQASHRLLAVKGHLSPGGTSARRWSLTMDQLMKEIDTGYKNSLFPLESKRSQSDKRP